MCIVELNHEITNIHSKSLGGCLECLQIASREGVERMLSQRQGFEKLVLTPRVRLKILFVLAVHGIYFSQCAGLGEQWRSEEAGEHVQCLLQKLRLHVEIIHCISLI